MSSLVRVVDDLGCTRGRVWFMDMQEGVDFRQQVGLAGRDISEHRDSIVADGGLFFGRMYDPMSDSFAELTGALFSTCQVMGVPCVFLSEDMDWAQDYAGYAAMLGIRRDLVCFGATIYGGDGCVTRSQVEQRINGLISLHNARFKTWVEFSLLNGASLAFSLEDIRRLAGSVDFIVADIPADLFMSLSREDVESFIGSVVELLEATETRLLLLQPLVSYITASGIDGTIFNHPSVVLDSDLYLRGLFSGSDVSVVVAGDINAVVEDVCREVSEENLRLQAEQLERDARDAVSRRGDAEVSSPIDIFDA